MAVEPTSLALLACDKTGNRSGVAWQAVLEPFAQLELVVSDAAKGIAAGVQAVLQGHRRSRLRPRRHHRLHAGRDPLGGIRQHELQVRERL